MICYPGVPNHQAIGYPGGYQITMTPSLWWANTLSLVSMLNYIYVRQQLYVRHCQRFRDWLPRCAKEDFSASTYVHEPLCFHNGSEEITHGDWENLALQEISNLRSVSGWQESLVLKWKEDKALILHWKWQKFLTVFLIVHVLFTDFIIYCFSFFVLFGT